MPLGISNESKLAYLYERYLSYTWYTPDDSLPRFMRARQFELNDANPSD